MNDKAGKEYKSLYRRWRPEKFSEVVGQEKALRILQNSVIRDNIAHAYLFAGPRGTGKTSVARIMAKAINCEELSEGEPCNSCPSCQKIENEQALDVIEIDGASNRGIDEIRELREEVNYMPAEAKYKVYIIDEVHMLTNEAFNALLKTLEEPPERVMFVFATTQPQKIPETIVSRCQVFEFKELPSALIRDRVAKVAAEEGLEITDRALDLVAKKGRGSMRDALVILEQMISYKTDQNITEEDLTEVLGVAEEETIHNYLRGIVQKETKKTLDTVSRISAKGKDFELFLEDLLDSLRAEIINSRSDSILDLPEEELITLSRKILDLLKETRRSTNKRLTLEIGTLEILELVSEKEKEKTSKESSGEGNENAKKEQSSSRKVETGGEQNGETPPDQAEGKWEKVLEEISEQRISIAAFLQEANIEKRGNEIVLEFHPDFSFHKESLERKENLSFLREMIDEHYGKDCALSVEYNTQMEKEEEHDLLEEKTEMVKNKFDGSVIERSKNLF